MKKNRSAEKIKGTWDKNFEDHTRKNGVVLFFLAPKMGFGGRLACILKKFYKKMHFFCQKFWRFRFLLYLCTTKTEQCSVRLAGPGRKILILEIMGSNPIPSTTN